jgi:hypothetical protein
MQGAARGHAGHGLRAQRWRSPRARRWPSSASAGRRTAAQRVAALLGEPVAAWHQRTETTGVAAHRRGDGDGDGRRRARRGGRLRSGRRGFGPRRSGRELSGRRRRARGDGRAARSCRERAALSEAARRRRGNAIGTGGRAVPTMALSRCAGATRGGYAAVARCRAGLARCAAADRWGPLVSDF